MNNIHIIDAGIVVCYLAVALFFGFYKSKSIKTLKEYTLGGGSFPDIVIITTLFATDICAVNTIGTAEKVHQLGVFFAITRMLSPLFWLIMIKVYARNIDQFRGCMSISDIMEMLYGKPGMWVTNIAAVLLSIAVVAIETIAMGYLLYYFFDIPKIIGMVIGVSVITLYSCFGGIKAVALTDVFQFAVFMAAIPIACSFAYHEMGGFHEMAKALPQEMLSININSDNIGIFISLIFYSLLPISGGAYVQRFLICKNSTQLINSMKVISVLSILFVAMICFIGFVTKIKAPDLPSHNAFMYFIENYLTVGVKGLIIAGLLAVMMSTADSWINTTSVLFAHDIISKVIKLTEKQALFVARISSLCIGILAICLSFFEAGIVELDWLAGNLWVPLILIPLTAGFLKFRTNNKSFIASSVLAIIFTVTSGYIVGDLDTISLMCGMIGSAIGLFGMHYFQQSNKIIDNQQITS